MSVAASLLSLSLALSPQQEAKTASEAPTGEIIVEAPPPPLERRRELKKLATNIIRKPRSFEAVGSFFKPICPKVSGVPAAEAAAIEARMIENATRLGVPASRNDKCKQNIAVVFMPSSEGPADQWLNYKSPFLRHLLGYERLRVINETGPVRAWNQTIERREDGNPFKDINGQDPADILLANRIWSASKMTLPTTSEIANATVLIELDAAQGKLLSQLADYATMRTFAATGGLSRDDVPAASTILTLFQDNEAPEELTIFDQALLSKLYDSARNARPSRMFSNIAARAARLEQKVSGSAAAE